MVSRPKIVAFDVIGTLFSLEALRAALVSLGLPPRALDLVYASAVRDAVALACTSGFAPFMKLLEGALAEVMAIEGVRATSAQMRTCLDAMHHLRPQAEAEAALTALSTAGFSIVLLSNGAASATQELVIRSGLGGLVGQVLSVEDVKLAKPRPEVYLYAARACGVRPGEVALVAEHPWDVQGAQAADLIGCYVARGRPYPAAFRPPDLAGSDLREVAERLMSL